MKRPPLVRLEQPRVASERSRIVRIPDAVSIDGRQPASPGPLAPQQMSLTKLTISPTLENQRVMAAFLYEQVDIDAHRGPGPSALHSVSELPRVFLEVSSLAWAWPLLGSAPRGDGHPVLVLPGFTAGDESTAVLRRYLKRLGYLPLPWRLGRNTGSFEVQEQLVHSFYRLTREHDTPISIIGQSLGGVFARELARQFTPHVRMVVTLGSPFASSGPETTNPMVSRLFQYVSGMTRDQMRDHMLSFPTEAPPVPCTAVYSKSDGVVHWSACLEYEGARAENIEIIGSHSGMAMNPLVYHVIADRLGKPANAWAPFRRPSGCPAMFFPTPENRTPVEPADAGIRTCTASEVARVA
jgi:pimeloyl-ACP methyl ester carboxylesterase